MATPRIDITYAAHTASCTFLLDAEGICRRIVMVPKGKRRESSRTAVRCVGAQYVASLDGSAAGGLVEMPRVGAAMLFARVDERGRISLVRTGVVTAFESHAAEDPFVTSGTVETSAPEILTPARPAQTERPGRTARTEREPESGDPDYCDLNDRTQRIQALRPEEIAAALGHDLKTAEYHVAGYPAELADEVTEDHTAELGSPRAAPPSDAPAATLRNPHRDAALDDDDDDYARPASPAASSSSRGVLPRRTDPKLHGSAAYAYDTPEPRPAPLAHASDVQISRRRRG